MHRELHGSKHTVTEVRGYVLAEVLAETAVVVAGIQATPFGPTCRIFHNISDDGLHEVLILKEGFKDADQA